MGIHQLGSSASRALQPCKYSNLTSTFLVDTLAGRAAQLREHFGLANTSALRALLQLWEHYSLASISALEHFSCVQTYIHKLGGKLGSWFHSRWRTMRASQIHRRCHHQRNHRRRLHQGKAACRYLDMLTDILSACRTFPWSRLETRNTRSGRDPTRSLRRWLRMPSRLLQLAMATCHRLGMQMYTLSFLSTFRKK